MAPKRSDSTPDTQAPVDDTEKAEVELAQGEAPPADEDDGWSDAKAYAESPGEKKVRVGTTKYVLQELMGDGVAKWMKFTHLRVTGGKKKPKPEDADYRDFLANLIVLCIRTENKQPVPFQKVRSWPASTLTGLFQDCQTMNGLNDDAREEAGK